MKLTKEMTKRRPPRIMLWTHAASQGFVPRNFSRRDMDIGDGIFVCMFVNCPGKEYECVEIQIHRNDILWLGKQMEKAWKETQER